MSFEAIAKELGRDEVAVAAIFYGQTKASEQDIKKLSDYFGIDHGTLSDQLSGFPDRGKSVEMPPKEPLIYRLYEIVQNYGYAYKAVMNEKFGDGIMSAIAFSTHVEKEVDKDGVTWVNIKLRGKWYDLLEFLDAVTDILQASLHPILKHTMVFIVAQQQHIPRHCILVTHRKWQLPGLDLECLDKMTF